MAGDADLQAVPVAERLWMYQLLTLIRVFEEKLLALKADNLINGPVHTSVGQEAVAVGAARAGRAPGQVFWNAPGASPVPRQGAQRAHAGQFTIRCAMA